MFGCALRCHREPCSLLPGVREMTSCGGGNWIHKFLRDAGFSLTTINPPIV